MSNFQRDESAVSEQRSPSRWPAPEIVSRLGGPVFVDMRPGHVRVVCQGFIGVGPDRMSAFRALADQVKFVHAS